MNPVIALLFDRRIPPSRQVNDVSCRRKRKSRPGSLGAEHEKVETSILGQMPLK